MPSIMMKLFYNHSESCVWSNVKWDADDPERMKKELLEEMQGELPILVDEVVEKWKDSQEEAKKKAR